MLSDAQIAPTLPSTDLARSRSFYEEVLRLTPEWQGEEEVLYRSGGGSRLLVYERPPSQAEHTLASFFVDDLDAEMADLRGRGVTFEEYDFPGLKTVEGVADGPEGMRAAWFKDPDGNILALTQMPRR
jgi:catechol 2,3-dioxygenase-like lactoylglutathione lyase family enzyme